MLSKHPINYLHVTTHWQKTPTVPTNVEGNTLLLLDRQYCGKYTTIPSIFILNNKYIHTEMEKEKTTT